MEIPLGNAFNLQKKEKNVQKMSSHHSKRRKRQNLKRRHWTLTESGHYLTYLQHHQDLFQDFRTKKQAKVFVNLAKQIRSRSTSQVKSHHQKMMIKFGSIDNIIISLLEEQEVYFKNHQSYFQEGNSRENHPIKTKEPQKLRVASELRQVSLDHNYHSERMEQPQGRLFPGFKFSLEEELPYFNFAYESHEDYPEGLEHTFLD